MRIHHTHPPGTTPEARMETLRLLYHRCLRELYGDSRLLRRTVSAQPTIH
ncbi:MAG: hypothetical protein HFF52_08640 [Lawsonibacter sp.]|nr:hypothetical protein [Lawsonibacter sp.]